jgi:leucyl/phenylalanyl-tRNA--protein transferase
MVLYVGELRIRRSLARALAARRFEIRVDTAFREVIGRCARVPRRGQGGTWITSAMVDAYAQLAERGLAHSVEAWRDGELVGGLYGVALGRMFFGESMFAEATDASKVALAHLVAILRCGGYPMIDCQQDTPHLASLGARPIARAQFAAELAALVHCPAPAGIWCPPPLEDVVP